MEKNTESKYTLLPVVETPHVNPGDDIKVGFYILGWGPEPIRSKLSVNLCGLKLGQKNITITEYVKSGLFEDGDKLAVRTGPKYSEPVEVSPEEGKTFTKGLDTGVFLRRDYQTDEVGSATKNFDDPTPKPLKPIQGELNHGEAPITLSFSLAEDIDPGNYQMNFALVTKNEDGLVDVDHHKEEIHVKTLYERINWFLEPLAAIVAISSLLLISFSQFGWLTIAIIPILALLTFILSSRFR